MPTQTAAMKPVLLAVDLGTESVRAALVSTEGRIVRSEIGRAHV